AFAPSGRLLGIADYLNGCVLADLNKTPPEAAQLFGQASYCVAFHPTKPLVAVGHVGVNIYDVNTRRRERAWSYPGRVAAMAFTPEGRHLLTANTNSTVYVLRLANLRDAAALPKP